MTTILAIWIGIFLGCLYLWLGIVFHDEIALHYRLSLLYALIIIFLWPVVVPIGLLVTQLINAWYILKNAYYKSKDKLPKSGARS